MKIHHEFRTLIPPLTAEERAGLEASIAAEGCRDPLVVWSGGDILLDGHNRYEICQRLGKSWNTKGLSFADKDEAKAWVIRNQFARRNLNSYQRAELALTLEAILRPAAEARMLSGKADPGLISSQGRVSEQIAAVAGVSSDTIKHVKYLQGRLSDPIKEQLRRGETTINREFQKVKNPGLLYQSNSNEWFTHPRYIEAARAVLGGIDLDPASTEEANSKTVRAARFYDAETNGLAHQWHGRVWLNPPYGGLSGPFTDKLITEYRSGRTTAAITLLSAQGVNNKWFEPLWGFVICFPLGRIQFSSPVIECDRITHGSVFVYLGPDEDRFDSVFRRFGVVVHQRAPGCPGSDDLWRGATATAREGGEVGSQLSRSEPCR